MVRSDFTYRLARFYVLVEHSGWVENLCRVLAEFIQSTNIAIWEHSLNYGPPHRFSQESLTRELERLTFSDFESLSAEEKVGALGLHVGAEFRYINVSGVYEYLFAFRSTEDFALQFKHLAESLCQSGKILYGYGRILSADFDPASEARITKSLFGGLRIKGGNPLTEWLENPKDIHDGAIKGIYTLNLINERRVQKTLPSWLSSDVLKRATRICNCYLIQMSLTDLASMSTRKGVGKYVRQNAE